MADDKYKKQIPGGTHDERLLETPRPDEFLHTDTWRVFLWQGRKTETYLPDSLYYTSRTATITSLAS